MHIKRYVAATLEEAVAEVKAELGPDALVLSTRRVRRDGGLFGWLGRPLVEVVAAIDREQRMASPPPVVAAPAEPSLVQLPASLLAAPAGAVVAEALARRSRATAPPARGPEPIDADPSWRALSLTQALLDPLEAELRALRRSVAELERPDLAGALAHELAELRQSVEAMSARGGKRRDPLEDRLLAAGFGARTASLLVRAAREAGEGADPRAALPGVLRARLDEHLRPPRPDEPARVTFLVGANGAGKTTTLAKLVGREAPGGRSRLAIVTTDVHRLGGVEALEAFARERGAAFSTAATPEALAAGLGKLRGRRVFVDTAGEGRADAAGIAELARARAALGVRARVHLVLAATTQEDDLRDELRRFAPLAPDSLVVTRTDDTSRLAPLANLLLDDGTPPLEWIGVGRRVPEDLAVPDPGELAARMLGVAA